MTRPNQEPATAPVPETFIGDFVRRYREAKTLLKRPDIPLSGRISGAVALVKMMGRRCDVFCEEYANKCTSELGAYYVSAVSSLEAIERSHSEGVIDLILKETEATIGRIEELIGTHPAYLEQLETKRESKEVARQV